MVGSTRAHNLIAGNLFAFLHQHLRGKPCNAFISDMNARVETVDAYYHPDVMVSCESAELKALSIQEPRLIIEVLSPSTESVDRREKRFAYQSLASFQEYIFVAQDESQVEGCCDRNPHQVRFNILSNANLAGTASASATRI